MNNLGYGFGSDRGFVWKEKRRVRFWKVLIVGLVILVAWSLRGDSNVLENEDKRPTVSFSQGNGRVANANDVYGVETGLVGTERR